MAIVVGRVEVERDGGPGPAARLPRAGARGRQASTRTATSRDGVEEAAPAREGLPGAPSPPTARAVVAQGLGRDWARRPARCAARRCWCWGRWRGSRSSPSSCSRSRHPKSGDVAATSTITQMPRPRWRAGPDADLRRHSGRASAAGAAHQKSASPQHRHGKNMAPSPGRRE